MSREWDLAYDGHDICVAHDLDWRLDLGFS